MLNYNQMEMKYGPITAYQCLREMEKAARMCPRDIEDIVTDLEARFAKAIRTQDEMMAA